MSHGLTQNILYSSEKIVGKKKPLFLITHDYIATKRVAAVSSSRTRIDLPPSACVTSVFARLTFHEYHIYVTFIYNIDI